MNLYKNLSIISFSLTLLAAGAGLSNASVGKDTLRVNSGADAPYTDSAGRVWVADSGFVGGQVYSETGVEIAGTTNDDLHLNERWDSQDFSYNFNVTQGTYKVNLH